MLVDCVQSLQAQSRRDFEVIIVDNSGEGLVRRRNATGGLARVIENERNAGFGAGVNQAFAISSAPFLATLNDDAVAHPEWMAALLTAAEMRLDAGMFASQVRLFPQGVIDSAGMLISGDGSSKQRGHGVQPSEYSRTADCLFPSGSAAMYRRAMLDEIGLFDEDFFLYCEDTDLGLRARWAGWRCLYVSDALVDHRYSHSAGRASALKAYYVERNRLFVVLKNFPARLLLEAPWVSLARYFWHLAGFLRGRGAAGEFGQTGSGFLLAWFVVKAHFGALARLGKLLKARRRIRSTARITTRDFCALIREHYISARQVGSL
jgi:GT2 family glycosyltransferase